MARKWYDPRTWRRTEPAPAPATTPAPVETGKLRVAPDEASRIPAGVPVEVVSPPSEGATVQDRVVAAATRTGTTRTPSTPSPTPTQDVPQQDPQQDITIPSETEQQRGSSPSAMYAADDLIPSPRQDPGVRDIFYGLGGRAKEIARLEKPVGYLFEPWRGRGTPAIEEDLTPTEMDILAIQEGSARGTRRDMEPEFKIEGMDPGFEVTPGITFEDLQEEGEKRRGMTYRDLQQRKEVESGMDIGLVGLREEQKFQKVADKVSDETSDLITEKYTSRLGAFYDEPGYETGFYTVGGDFYPMKDPSGIPPGYIVGDLEKGKGDTISISLPEEYRVKAEEEFYTLAGERYKVESDLLASQIKATRVLPDPSRTTGDVWASRATTTVEVAGFLGALASPTTSAMLGASLVGKSSKKITTGALKDDLTLGERASYIGSGVLEAGIGLWVGGRAITTSPRGMLAKESQREMLKSLDTKIFVGKGSEIYKDKFVRVFDIGVKRTAEGGRAVQTADILAPAYIQKSGLSRIVGGRVKMSTTIRDVISDVPITVKESFRLTTKPSSIGQQLKLITRHPWGTTAKEFNFRTYAGRADLQKVGSETFRTFPVAGAEQTVGRTLFTLGIKPLKIGTKVPIINLGAAPLRMGSTIKRKALVDLGRGKSRINLMSPEKQVFKIKGVPTDIIKIKLLPENIRRVVYFKDMLGIKGQPLSKLSKLDVSKTKTKTKLVDPTKTTTKELIKLELPKPKDILKPEKTKNLLTIQAQKQKQERITGLGFVSETLREASQMSTGAFLKQDYTVGVTSLIRLRPGIATTTLKEPQMALGFIGGVSTLQQQQPAVITATTMGFGTTTATRTDLIQRPIKIPQPIPQPIITPIPTPTPRIPRRFDLRVRPVFNFDFPSLGFEQRRPRTLVRPRLPRRTPSLFAIAAGIQEKAPRPLEETGLVLRPMINGNGKKSRKMVNILGGI